MKKKLRYILSVCIILSLCMSITAFAENTTTMKSSPSATAGSYKTDSTYNLAYSSSYSHVCGGDIGTWFYTSSVGLQSGFYRSSSRKLYVDLYEKDDSSTSKARSYTGTFSEENGVYRPRVYSITYTNSSEVESDGRLELFIKFKVGTNSQDKSTAVPSGLFNYKFWSY